MSKNKKLNDIKKNEITLKYALRFLALIEIYSLSIGIAGCNKKTSKPVTHNPTSINDINDSSIENLNLKDDESIFNYATHLKSLLKETEYIDVYDIFRALKLANIDYLDDNQIFTDKDQAHLTIEVLGKLCTTFNPIKINKYTFIEDRYIRQDEFIKMLKKHTDDVLVDGIDYDEEHGLMNSYFNKVYYDKRYGYCKYSLMYKLSQVINDEDNIYNERAKRECSRLFIELVNQRFNGMGQLKTCLDSMSYITLGMFIKCTPNIYSILEDEIDDERYTISYPGYSLAEYYCSAGAVLSHFGVINDHANYYGDYLDRFLCEQYAPTLIKKDH